MCDGKAMKDLVLGDAVVMDDGQLGISVRIGSDRKVWFNAKGAMELLRWLAIKHGIVIDTPNAGVTLCRDERQ
jgi:hypothetical protein